jgi:hypothetical protein
MKNHRQKSAEAGDCELLVGVISPVGWDLETGVSLVFVENVEFMVALGLIIERTLATAIVMIR